MAKPRRSFGDKFERSNKHIFVGRKDLLHQFEHNLRQDPYADTFNNIINIHGLGGVGKTTLLEEYLKLCKSANYLTAFVDTEDNHLFDVTATMQHIAEAFEQQGFPFRQFAKRYKVYLQKKGELDADPDRPKGTMGKLVSAGIRVGSKLAAESIPGGGSLHQLMPTEKISEVAGEWADFVAKKITNKDDRSLVLQPLKVLTPLWLEDLYELDEQDKKIAIFLDTYEAANPKLDQWLFDLFNKKYGQIPSILLVIAGRTPLDATRWSRFSAFIDKNPLEAFSETEARDFLIKKGFSNEAVIESTLAISKCLPVYLALLAEGDKDSFDAIGNPNDEVVRRFLKHIKDPLRETLVLHSALPNELNQDILECLLPPDTQIDLGVYFAWLKNQPFVEKRGGRWTYHPIVQESMHRFLREKSEQTYQDLHYQLAAWYAQKALPLQTEDHIIESFQDEQWRTLLFEKNYHLLATQYKKYLPPVINDLVRVLYRVGFGAAMPLVKLMEKAERVLERKEGLSEVFTVGIEGVLNGQENLVLPMLQHIADLDCLANQEENSYIYYGIGLYETNEEQKIIAYQKAIELNPEDADTWNNMGVAYANLKEYSKAIQVYLKATEINPEHTYAWSNMGGAYTNLKEHKKAIQVYLKATEINPENADAWNNMGVAYDNLKEHKKAIQYFQKATEINPEYAYVWNNMGLAYTNLKEHKKAIQYFQKATEINPEYENAWNNIGGAYYNLKEYTRAIQYYQKATEINPEYENAWHNIGWNSLLLADYTQAQQHLLKSWELSRHKYPFAPMNLGHCAWLTADRTTAMEWHKKSIPLWENTEDYFAGMESDYIELDMSEKGITRAAYEEALHELRAFAEQLKNTP